MAEAEAVSDLDQRATILREAEEVAMEGQPVAPIYYYVSKQLVSPTVVGWVDNVPDKYPTRFLDLKQSASLPRPTRRVPAREPAASAFRFAKGARKRAFLCAKAPGHRRPDASRHHHRRLLHDAAGTGWSLRFRSRPAAGNREEYQGCL